jgi:hypothetical protein
MSIQNQIEFARYLKKLGDSNEACVPKLKLKMHTRGLSRPSPACYDPCCRKSQAIGDTEVGVGSYTLQQAVDLAHT